MLYFYTVAHLTSDVLEGKAVISKKALSDTHSQKANKEAILFINDDPIVMVSL